MAAKRDLKPGPEPADERAGVREPSNSAVGAPGRGRGADPPSPRSESELDHWRHRIDLIDEQLMKLLNSRSACAVEIGRIKRALGLPVYSPEREAWILERVMSENPGPLDALAVRRVFERIIDESRRLERLAADEEA